MKNPRRMRLMTVNSGVTTDDPWHPEPGANGAGTGGGTLYGATETEANNLFADSSFDALIHEVRVDKGTAAQLTLYAGAVESGADAAVIMSSSTTHDGQISAPFVLAGGFHCVLSATGSFSIVYEVIPEVSGL